MKNAHIQLHEAEGTSLVKRLLIIQYVRIQYVKYGRNISNEVVYLYGINIYPTSRNVRVVSKETDNHHLNNHRHEYPDTSKQTKFDLRFKENKIRTWQYLTDTKTKITR
jgi:hypothetical protein